MSTHVCDRPLKVHDGARDGREGGWARDQGLGPRAGSPACHILVQSPEEFQNFKFEPYKLCGGIFTKVGEKDVFYLTVCLFNL